MTKEEAEIGLASLSVLTRQMVIGEVERALNDTSVEYHRQTTRELQCKLATEVHALKSFLEVAKNVEAEVKEINGEGSSGDSTSRQVFRTSSGSTSDEGA